MNINRKPTDAAPEKESFPLVGGTNFEPVAARIPLTNLMRLSFRTLTGFRAFLIAAIFAGSMLLAQADAKPAAPEAPSKPTEAPKAAEPVATPEAEKPAPNVPEAAKPETAKPEVTEPKTTDAQLEKLATESEKDAVDEAKKQKEAAEKEKKKEDPAGEKKATKTDEGEKDKEGKEPAKESKQDKKTAKKDKDKAGGNFQPDFRDQEIQDVLKLFSKIIGKNIIADEKVKGKITVISPYKIPRSLAYPYLYSMLAIKGFGIVEENENLIRVVAMKDALAGSPLIFLGRQEIKDATIKSDLPVTQILPVYGSKPSKLSGILKRLTSANTDLVDYDEINMLIISGSQYEVNRLIRVANLIDYKGPEPECDLKKDPECGKVIIDNNVHVYRLENMQAENVEATLKKVQLPVDAPTPAGPPGAGGAPTPTVTQANVQKKPIDVIAHKETNSIIYVGTNDEFNLVKSLIKRIDLQRQQVLLEVLIVEVGSADNRSLGIDWLVGSGGGAQFNGGIAANSGLVNPTTGKLDGSRLNTSSGFSVTFLQSSISDVIGILNAQIGRTNFTVVSAPQVLTLDNQEAEINVGQDVPVRVNSFTNVTGTQSNSFEYRPVGIKLKFTPQVNKSRMVTINLYQEVKSIVQSADPAANPTISKKDIKTFVRVQDAQTIVIGGLVSNERNASIIKVPILGDFPLIGYLFRRTKMDVARKNLMVFITPHILTNRAIADKVTEDLRQDQIRENKRGQID